MLKFTQLFNFGLAGALIVPSLSQSGNSSARLQESLHATERALASLADIEDDLSTGDYDAVERILAATEAPVGDEQARDALLDKLRNEVGELNARVERIDGEPVLPHLSEDPTETLTPAELEHVHGDVPTTGLSEEGRNELGRIWPPVVGGGAPSAVRTADNRFSFEPENFSVDPVLQGRAYYRAGRYKEALTLLNTRLGEPAADYWIGRCYERLGRSREAIAAYTAVVNNPDSSVMEADRAKQDREFLDWLIDFERKLQDLHGATGGSE